MMDISSNKDVFAPKKVQKMNSTLEEWDANKIVFRVLLLVSCLKVLLMPTYHSTDFEVHRNWLAITHSLPLKEWYMNANSQWTLDYPPLFAWFEYFLSHIARLIDHNMLKVENLNYASSNTILFQRGTVIFLDLVYAYGVKEVGKVFCTSFDEYVIFIVFSLCNMGLLLVDHVHFQYNGFLLGILLLAIANVSKINKQIISRLFPFKRGLVHAYWAANAWALYIGIDKIASLILKQLGWLKVTRSAVMTGGLVQEQSFLVLPTPTPIVTFLLTIFTMMPALYYLLCKKEYMNPKQFVRCLVLCVLCSFMFGWHVHEKAILTAIIPLCVLAATDKNDARIYLILSSAGHTALLPLLYPSNLTPLKILVLLVFMSAGFLVFSRKFNVNFLYFYEYIYVINLPVLTVYETIIHKLIFGEKLPFLPLALTSLYCAIGVTYSWVVYYYMFLRYSKINNYKNKIQ
ncbi:probable dolichyl pyrophosphate Glc1Man9GlcNAc2 alpha-1,3-glucosyltransferase isoform X3 [Bombus bifarius]|uniref:Alpha-1,3-glucosyltransferase n=2 Tax=Pyrobombus TaxID=144703 RepID=A0A6P8N694_9HYME|nr:probable dolichyl pyrophosphate Glc1Man9GlcNAc2 alpha-1,3-glucosyltransferase isoform X3 [Bombus vancouverensis nearcticus]XP_033316014.1 probable dolichyl pyrophosphate Glc1Man9GlcNAc2 alpha-1,3-glucosyltransferase isoform X3 [Bombus bifarius]